MRGLEGKGFIPSATRSLWGWSSQGVTWLDVHFQRSLRLRVWGMVWL